MKTKFKPRIHAQDEGDDMVKRMRGCVRSCLYLPCFGDEGGEEASRKP